MDIRLNSLDNNSAIYGIEIDKLTTVVLLEFGELPIQVPRDRNGDFEPLIVKKNQTSLSGLEEKNHCYVRKRNEYKRHSRSF